jgi:hypothetical protein
MMGIRPDRSSLRILCTVQLEGWAGWLPLEIFTDGEELFVDFSAPYLGNPEGSRLRGVLPNWES